MSEQNQTRRDFLKASGVAAGAAVASHLGLAPAVHAAGSDTIKVGIIGCGGRGSGAAENVLHSAKGVQIVALGDVFKFRVNGLRNRITAHAKENKLVNELGNSVDLPADRCYAGLDAYEKVINTPGVNYIILATPPGFRPQHLQAAVAAGKHIFTEKPVGVDGPGIRKVLKVYEDATAKGLGIAAGTQRRHQTGYIETIQAVHDGAIGDITALRCYWNGHGIWFRPRSELQKHGIEPTDLAFQLHNWYHFVWTCGDHICEQHVHNLDVCNWAMRTHPVKAVGVGGRHCRPEGKPQDVGHIFDVFNIDFEYPGGVHMTSMCQHIPTCDNNVSEALVGTKGTCQVNAYTINGKRLLDRRKGRGASDPYVQEHTDLIESIRAGKPINELKNVAESTLTSIMGRMAAYTGRTVTWDQALNSKLDTMPENLAWDMSLPVSEVPVPGKTPLL